MFNVYCNDKPCNDKLLPGFTGYGFEKHSFDTFDKARDYLFKWLDFLAPDPDDIQLNVAWTDGYGCDTYIIKEE